MKHNKWFIGIYIVTVYIKMTKINGRYCVLQILAKINHLQKNVGIFHIFYNIV